MELTTIRELFKNREEYLDKEVTVGGWIRSIRDSKTFGFIVLNDGSYFDTLQIVYHDKMENFAEVSKLNVGAAIIVKGTLVATPQAKQPFEIQAEEVVIEGASAPDYPLQKKRHSFEYLRTISHLRPSTIYISFFCSRTVECQPVTVMEGVSPSVMLAIHPSDVIHPGFHTVDLLLENCLISTEQIDIPRKNTCRVSPRTRCLTRTKCRYNFRYHTICQQLFLIHVI